MSYPADRIEAQAEDRIAGAMREVMMIELARALDVPREALDIPAANHWSALYVSGRRWAAYCPPVGGTGAPLPTALLPRPSEQWVDDFRAHLEAIRGRVPCPTFDDEYSDWTW